MSDPSNWRGICLQDMVARVLSSILAGRLQVVLATYGIAEQFGSQAGRGCIDGIFTVRSVLQIRRYHNLPTWGLFLDLVKAYDTIQHELLFKALGRMGVPPVMLRTIMTLYQDFTLIINLRGSKAEIPYSVGVKQGDNMAPLLFIIVMQCVIEALEPVLAKYNVAPLSFSTFPPHGRRGWLLSQLHRSAGQRFRFRCSLYVDDGAFFFATREDLEKGARIIVAHFKRFGLFVHVGEEGTKSKSLAMHFPSALNTIDETLPENIIIDAIKCIQFVNRFKYLGSILHIDLTDDADVAARLAKANQQMGQLRGIFADTNIPMNVKRNLYLAIPFNTAIWGCESWCMSAATVRKLTTFHLRALRRLLNLNMFEVEQYSITNEAVLGAIAVPAILDFIRRLQLLWIHSILCMPHHLLPARLLLAWVQHPRKPGHPQRNLRHAYVDALQDILPAGSITDQACLADWTVAIGPCSHFSQLLKHWWKNCLPDWISHTKPPQKEHSSLAHTDDSPWPQSQTDIQNMQQRQSSLCSQTSRSAVSQMSISNDCIKSDGRTSRNKPHAFSACTDQLLLTPNAGGLNPSMAGSLSCAATAWSQGNANSKCTLPDAGQECPSSPPRQNLASKPCWSSAHSPVWKNNPIAKTTWIPLPLNSSKISMRPGEC